MPAIRLFLSCVTNEFGSYRSLLAHDLAESGLIEVEKQESFKPYGESTLLMLDDYVKSCDCVIHIAGAQTGAIATEADRKPIIERYGYAHLFKALGLSKEVVDDLSYTQWEAWLAVLHGRKLYICTPMEAALRDATIADAEEYARQTALQARHLELLQKQGRYAEVGLRFQDQRSLSFVLFKTLLPLAKHENSEVVVPKDLRQFDESDAGFYLNLLPGVHYQFGEKRIPPTVQFWKLALESDQRSFPVGVLLGVSGSGKSSFFRAGVLPLVHHTKSGKNIVKIFHPASQRNFEQTLLNTLIAEPHCPSVPDVSTLTDFVRGYMADEGSSKRKLVIILDQFEQWLQFWDRKPSHDLINAMKLCDGVSVQFVLIVRDDFCTVVDRFMDVLGLDLNNNENFDFLQLFDVEHAKNVLIAFGQAYQRVDNPPTPAQSAFIEQAVMGLANESKNEVVPLRLSVFADMMRVHDWNMSAWKEVGGVEGLGVKFLRERLGSSEERRFRRHREAAKHALRCLLPEDETNIKSQVPISELQKRSGYEGKDKLFAELIQILHRELRLIVPTDGEEDQLDVAGEITDSAGEQYFQLTHDFLVTAVRDWLALAQQDSAKGKAMQLLEKRSAAWHIQKINRALPTMREYCVIRWRTEKYSWSERQREMMRVARRVFRRKVAQLLLVGLILIVASVFAFQAYRKGVAAYRQSLAGNAVNELQVVSLSKIEQPINTIAQLSSFADPILDRKITEYDNVTDDDAAERKIRCAMALLPRRSEQKEFLLDQLLSPNTPTDYFPVVKASLTGAGIDLTEPLRREVELDSDSSRFCRAVLAMPSGEQIVACKLKSQMLAEILVGLSNDEYALTKNLVPEAIWELRTQLASIYTDESKDPAERSTAASILSMVPPTDEASEFLVPLIFVADSTKSFKVLFNAVNRNKKSTAFVKEQAMGILDRRDPDRERSSRRQAIAAIVLAFLEDPKQLWDRINDVNMHRFRSHVIHLLSSLEFPSKVVVERFKSICNDASRSEETSTLIQAIGDYGDKIEQETKAALSERIVSLMRTAVKPNVLGAGAWLMRTWSMNEAIDEIMLQRRGNPSSTDDLFVNSQGLSFARINPKDNRFKSIVYFKDDAKPNSATLVYVPSDHQFWFSTYEVTCAQWEAYLNDTANGRLDKAPWKQPILNGPHGKGKSVYPTEYSDCPIVNIDRFDAMRYCNWLSLKEGLAPVYKATKGVDLEQGYTINWQASGYRLPFQHEWELASRAGSDANRYYGDSDRLLANYAWCNQPPATGVLNPIGLCKPNSLGIFDTLGNAMEWCHDPGKGNTKEGLHLRGAAYLNLVSNIDYKYIKYREGKRDYTDGIRLVRTYKP